MVESGWITQKGAAAFNIYLAASAAAAWADPAKAGRWLDHVGALSRRGRPHHQVLRPSRAAPGEKINHGIVLGGEQGIGKDTLLAPLRYAVGPWNFQDVSPVVMMGRFNGFNRCVVLVISEVKDMGEVNRFLFYEHMKTYLAAPPDTLRTDEKNKPEYYILNVCGVIMTTNHKTGGIYLPADDRRNLCRLELKKAADFPEGTGSNSGSGKRTADSAHVAAYLQTLDISDFDPKAPPPRTSAFWEIVNSNRSTEEAELSDIFEQLANWGASRLAETSGCGN